MAQQTPRRWGRLSGPMVVDCSEEAKSRYHSWPPPSICSFRNAKGELFHDAERNACLVSAAPDLLTACKELLRYARGCGDTAMMERARAAIAKAEAVT